ncbi:uncharacterized protein YndB with AHSA1/START domain [Bacillus sp. OAE603]
MMNKNQFKVEKNELVITRVLDAPRELVFKVWSEKDHLRNWWGPTGLELKVESLDFRPGGKFHYSMSSPEGFEMWGLFVYGEIVKPEKIVFVNSFSDKDGNITNSPFPQMGPWPLEVHNTLTLEENDGKTTLTLRGYPINATEEEIKSYEAGHESMKQGFGGTFKQLEEYLAKVSL